MNPQMQMKRSEPTVVYLDQPGSQYKAYKSLITAQFAGVSLKSEKVAACGDAKTHATPLMESNPWKRLPFIHSDEGVIAGSNSMARHVAKTRADNMHLLGCDGFTDAAKVDSWLEWCQSELEVPANLLTWLADGKIQSAAGNSAALSETAKGDLSRCLEVVESTLKTNSKFGSQPFLLASNTGAFPFLPSLADVCVVCSLLDVFTTALDASFRKKFPLTEAWFSFCVALPQFQAVLKGKGTQLAASGKSFAPPARTSGGKKGAAAPAAAAPAGAGSYPSGTPADHAALDAAKAKVMDLKKQKASKDALKPHLDEMLRLKAVCGDTGKPAKGGAAPAAAAAKPAPAAAAPAASGGAYPKGTPADHAALDAAKAKVVELKKQKASKDEIQPALNEMLRLKDVCGEVPPPKKKK